jgi:osmotically-inducible protein OsmY
VANENPPPQGGIRLNQQETPLWRALPVPASLFIGFMNKSFAKLIGSVAAAILLAACAGGPNERSAGETFDDAAILAKAKAALVSDPEIKGSSSVVRSEREKKKVLETVWGVNGVKSVQTDLQIRAPNP